MNLANIGVSIMHQSECIVALAEGGFKIINGPSTKDKGPMTNEEDQEPSNKASLPQPTQAGRIELCTELISKARRCLGNGDRECVVRALKELIQSQCHEGNAVGGEVAGNVKGVFHELWLVSDGGEVCRLLRVLKGLGISRSWVSDALGVNTKALNKWLTKCGIDWEGKATRNKVVKDIEDLLRKELGWDKIKMCEELWRFVCVDVDEFRRYGIEPCAWLSGLELLSDLRRPYWLGLRVSDLVVRRIKGGVELEINTTSSIDAVFFPVLLSAVKTPSLKIEWKRGAPAAKYVSKSIALSYYVNLSANAWPWPIKLSTSELKGLIKGFSDEELAEFIAGEIDGDGSVWYDYENGYACVEIVACKNCPKRMMLDVLKEVIAKRFGIVGYDYSKGTDDALKFGGEDAVKLLRRIARYVHHPLKRLRIELILALYDGRISPETFEKLYDATKYELGRPDIKRNNALATATWAAPQTHTHGVKNNFPNSNRGI
jgi:hypothetical protein